LVTAKEVAAACSLRIDRVYELARTGRIPSIHVGKRAMRFDIDAVREALAC
jgi:excisionase family DNA binding protein